MTWGKHFETSITIQRGVFVLTSIDLLYFAVDIMNIEEEIKKRHQQNCSHKCHEIGLNDWVEFCPICGCDNPKFDPDAISDIEI